MRLVVDGGPGGVACQIFPVPLAQGQCGILRSSPIDVTRDDQTRTQ